MTDLAGYFTELANAGPKRPRDRALWAVLRLVSHPYAWVLRLRTLGYRLGLLPSHRLSCPVISVGNLALGGTGKTPMVALLAAELMGRGWRVAVLSRGYGGSTRGELVVSDGTRLLATPEQAGDEPCLLAQKVPGLMVVIGADRYRAGLLALRELNPDLCILDDGFQHLRLKRDLDILLLDASRPFANGYTLPAGFLREPVEAARRADLVVYTRCAQAGLPRHFPEKPACWTSHQISGLRPLDGAERCGFEPLKGVRVTAFSGIAAPASFFDLLESQGVPLAATLPFTDHVVYGEDEIAAICRLKTASGSAVLVTTEKDAVKLAPFAERIGPCYVAFLDLVRLDVAALDLALEKFPPR